MAKAATMEGANQARSRELLARLGRVAGREDGRGAHWIRQRLELFVEEILAEVQAGNASDEGGSNDGR